MRKYKYNKRAGALQEALHSNDMPVDMPVQQMSNVAPARMTSMAMPASARTLMMEQHAPAGGALPGPRERVQMVRRDGGDGVDRTPNMGGASMFFYTVEDGQQVLMRAKDGTMEVLVGPTRVWRRGRRFTRMAHHVAHPGDFLILRFRDGRQEHLAGPADVWFDPRTHSEITREEALQIAAKEAVVVYSEDGESGEVSRRVEHGPTVFIPKPGEWLHSFSWHGSAQLGDEMVKVPGGLKFEKLWLMPDQMYHNVPDVRTGDDAVLTVRLMMFFELVDIEKMLATTHDPIGDFVNAATSDVVDFVGRHDFESFKANTDKLNALAAYTQLTSRAEQCGYRINKVVYRGYGAPASLQQMHDQAIESRTRLQLEKETERQAQELEDFKLDRRLAREAREREEVAASLEHELEVQQRREKATRDIERGRRLFQRQQAAMDAEQARADDAAAQGQQRQHLEGLHTMGVDLTRLLTAGRADRVIELRGGEGQVPHVHLREE